ncbi:MAG: hydantoinase/oxoprolinase family protein [Desulfobulbus sp.]|jgi:N-methylhydantoinase A/oxoprolinase/acetone carboxylase beta subunit|uniref:hydantoinase/oxoprolinase family protein n=1 Tax=Desulfobulbus sp. TaxID=895 RepID=UPI0028425D9B|nr:hydantoinase/oxoprolinase family protein [Desulfobulbus sp.]MDR2551079.1 hydantoinase/oxoprolinase family protein [Desulfobulbus sp.]
MTTYCIGIDTGGTYTDAVLLDLASGRVVDWRKERTTPHDLSLGVGRALQGLLRQSVQAREVTGLSVSTTLATNAVVEGQGARVGLFVFGPVRHFKLPVVANIFLKGGHTITGEEDEPLDIEGLVDTLPMLAKEVDSYAVCGAMSIKNPAHELVACEAIRLIDPKPVFCSHLVSGHPGMLERSATACLHARLMPLMTDFLASIQRSMLAAGLNCPVTIICGNGCGEALDRIADQAAITMASGPAATARFGAAGGFDSALVVDVGGTTTDVCLIKDGEPLLNREGCVIGEWRTHVEAVDMYTAGAGGDSHVMVHGDGRIVLGGTRVQPLAMTPDLPDPRLWLNRETDTYLVLPVDGLDPELVRGDEVLGYLAQHGPTPPSVLAAQTGTGGILLEKKLERLMFLQRVVLAGFTPTDALHGLGLLDIGQKAASQSGAEVLAAQLGTTAEAFCRQVVTETEAAIETILLTYLARTVWKDSPSAALLNRRDNSLFSMHFTVKLPLIGIGAAARCFLPGVASRLGTTVAFPEHCEVGNAVGAALIAMRG